MEKAKHGEFEDAVAGIREHVLGGPPSPRPGREAAYDCLPFPAGPVIPRLGTREQPGSGTITAVQRCRLAVELLGRDYLYVDRRPAGDERAPNRKSALTRTSWMAFREWFDRHPALAADENLVHPGHAMLSTIEAIAAQGHDPGSKLYVSEVGEFRGRLTLMRRRESNALRVGGQIDELVFGSKNLKCQCHEDHEAEPSCPATHHEVDRLLQTSDGLWRLLSGFFLNWLHSLLAWNGDSYRARGSRTDDRSTLHSAALRILTLIAYGEGSGSNEAVGLLSTLSRLEGYATHAGDGVPVLNNVPYCFLPDAIGDLNDALADCRNYLANHWQASAMVPDIAALAQEVAAALTDPAFVRHANATEAACRLYVNHYDHTRDVLKAFDDAAGLRWAMPRVGRLRAYFNWMRDRGLAITLESRHCLPAPPKEPVVAVGRPSREDSL